MNPEIIESRKFREEIFREARALAKTDKCFLCEQKNVHFCNSHLIPHFILKNIAHNGKVKNFGCFAFKGDASFDSECGLSNAGTFHFICRKCDSYYFSDYENESNIRNSIFSSRFFAQIIIKNFLSRLYKKNTESHIPDLLSKKCDVFFETQFDLDLELDKRDFYEDLMRQRGIIENSLLNRHHILFQKKLTYKVPFAVQAHMALHRNINGEIINDVYCRDKDYKIRSMHLCIFPLQEETIIILFIDKFAKKRYNRFINSLIALPLEEQLQYITYLAFKYTEDIFFSPQLPDCVFQNKSLQLLAEENYDRPHLGCEPDYINNNYRPVDFHDIPNLLSQQYRI